MVFSFYISGTPSGYNQYPADNNSILLQNFAQDNTSESQLTVCRKGQLVYYAYSRRLQEKSNNFLAFCLIFNGVYCRSSKKLFNLFDKVFYDVQLKGELLKFEKGKSSYGINNFAEKQIEIERIYSFFKYNIENDFKRDFAHIPVSFEVGNGKKTISLKENDNDILAAKSKFDIVHISNNEKSLSELERAHKMLTDIYAEKQDLDKKYKRLLSQKKQYKVVLILCLILFCCIFGLFAFKNTLQSKDMQISNLNMELSEKQTDIENLNTQVTNLQVEGENLKSENLRLTNEVSQLSDMNIDLRASNVQLNFEISDKNNQISNLISLRNIYKRDYNKLQLINQSLSSDVETYKKYAPVTYKAISDASYYYKYRCGESYEKTKCYLSSGNYISIYTTANGYGLAENGWVKMSDLSK